MTEPTSEEIARRLHEFMEDAQQHPLPLSPMELRILRAIITERANASWLRKKILAYSPHVAAFVAGAWALWGFVAAHWKNSP